MTDRTTEDIIACLATHAAIVRDYYVGSRHFEEVARDAILEQRWKIESQARRLADANPDLTPAYHALQFAYARGTPQDVAAALNALGIAQ